MQSELSVMGIPSKVATPWVMNRHYARRRPSISHAFGLFESGLLVGVVTYGAPASPCLCVGVCGVKNKSIVLELNRLCVGTSTPNATSFLVGGSLRMLPRPRIVVSYADTSMGHVGYVYQATNFLYTGCTKPRTDMASKDGKHSRHNMGDVSLRQYRSAKHRYITFVGTRKEKAVLRSQLRYEVIPYPKGDIRRYDASGYAPQVNITEDGVLYYADRTPRSQESHNPPIGQS